jgi:hypothetical protein
MRKHSAARDDMRRFQMVADFIATTYGDTIHTIADVAGGEGMLTKILSTQYHYAVHVIDPQRNAIDGVESIHADFQPHMAEKYDLVVGLHPDEATKAIVEAALIRPTLLIPCCNYWDETKILEGVDLVEEIERYYQDHSIQCMRHTLPFAKVKNIALTTRPPILT